MATPHTKHYIVGAGHFGCLYDFGPEFHDSAESAVESVRFYLDTGEPTERDYTLEILNMAKTVRRVGVAQIHFSGEDRGMFGAYIEITEADGPCPESED